MQICLSKTFTASAELNGTVLVLDEWLPLDLTNLSSATVVLVGSDEFVRAILDEHGDAILDEYGNAIIEE